MFRTKHEQRENNEQIKGYSEEESMSYAAAYNHSIPVSRMSDQEYSYYCRKRYAALRRTRNRRILILAVLSFFVILSLGVMLRTLKSEASVTEDPMPYKYCTFHKLADGETLESIAGEYMDSYHYSSVAEYCAEVRVINRIYEDEFGFYPTGTMLVVPYYSECKMN